jgi:hypothetical protein
VEPPDKLGQRSRFYDGGHPGDDRGVGAEPADRHEDVLVILDRQLATDDRGRPREVFILRRRIAYDDRHCGEIIVPPVFATFETDLTSVPALFSWLVPTTGAHLPAALLHDGLVWNRRTEAPTYISTPGKLIDRVEADRVFRDAMADTGTGLVRRWLVWTAVTLATMWSQDATAASRLGRAYYRWIMVASLFAVVWLGYVATADLFDRSDDWWLAYELSWMGDRSFGVELLTGVAAAIVIPAVLGVLWGRFRAAGWIAGIGVAVLVHVTVGMLAVTALYVTLEWIAARLTATWLVVLAGAIAAAATAVFVVSLL